MKKLSIVLAYNHALVRAGIRALVERIPNVVVAGEAGNRKETLELIEKTRPDIALLVLDLEMPELNGHWIAELRNQNFPDLKVIVLSMNRSPDLVIRALQSGSDGYIVKDAAPSELAAAIHAVARGESYLSPAISMAVVASSLVRAGQAKPAKELTARQRQVLRLLVEGRTMKEIALMLEVSVKTVETHRAQLMHRLEIRDIPGLVRYAMRTGLTPPENPR